MSSDQNPAPKSDPEPASLSIIVDSEENAIGQSSEGPSTSRIPPIVKEEPVKQVTEVKKRKIPEMEGFYSWELQKEYLKLKEGLELFSQFRNLFYGRFEKLEKADEPSGSAKKKTPNQDEDLLKAGARKSLTRAEFLRDVSSMNGVVLETVSDSNLAKFKEIVEAITPFKKDENFYNSVLESPDLVYMAVYNDAVVGAIYAEKRDDNVVFIKALGVLPAFKGKRIGQLLFGTVLAVVEKMKEILEIEMHVQAGNGSAIHLVQFMGFKKTWTRDPFYVSFPRDAFFYRKSNINQTVKTYS
uniref:N-terminal methionine N(alpha)-acetyltransferase NatE n=1 Tax=Caenorhabditis tropicalis TaxID=1561998 RepID=A0A1I7TC31_9PELO